MVYNLLLAGKRTCSGRELQFQMFDRVTDGRLPRPLLDILFFSSLLFPVSLSGRLLSPAFSSAIKTNDHRCVRLLPGSEGKNKEGQEMREKAKRGRTERETLEDRSGISRAIQSHSRPTFLVICGLGRLQIKQSRRDRSPLCLPIFATAIIPFSLAWISDRHSRPAPELERRPINRR
jgi:hypothetical protein